MIERPCARALALGAGLLALSVGGCDGTFQVYYPAALQAYSQEYTILSDGRLNFYVFFTRSPDPASLIAGENVILETEEEPNAEINLYLHMDVTVLQITTIKGYHDLLTFDPDGFFNSIFIIRTHNKVQPFLNHTICLMVYLYLRFCIWNPFDKHEYIQYLLLKLFFESFEYQRPVGPTKTKGIA